MVKVVAIIFAIVAEATNPESAHLKATPYITDSAIVVVVVTEVDVALFVFTNVFTVTPVAKGTINAAVDNININDAVVLLAFFGGFVTGATYNGKQ